MEDSSLKWDTLKKEKALHTPVFDVFMQHERSADGTEGDYVAMTAPEWVVIVPVYRDQFVMVRQWRHGEDRITVEFPGGVGEKGEDPAVSAERELLEETGFMAGRITELGVCSPNPALFKNHFHVFLAEDLVPTGEQHLDDDEFLNCMLMPREHVISSFGSGEFTHAFTGTALAFYMRHIGYVPRNDN
ncbi:MAG: NUDIX hydrolase [Clostridia bacterium]|nr:NUDIX hydrolase [Clostridia bacterium]